MDQPSKVLFNPLNSMQFLENQHKATGGSGGGGGILGRAGLTLPNGRPAKTFEIKSNQTKALLDKYQSSLPKFQQFQSKEMGSKMLSEQYNK